MKKEHKCDKFDVSWNNKPSADYSEEGVIYWHGKCSICGRKVCEIYRQEPELYDIETKEEI